MNFKTLSNIFFSCTPLEDAQGPLGPTAAFLPFLNINSANLFWSYNLKKVNSDPNSETTEITFSTKTNYVSQTFYRVTWSLNH